MNRFAIACILGYALAGLAAQDPTVEIARAYLAAKTPADTDADARFRSLLAAAATHRRTPAAAILLHACFDLVPMLRDPAAAGDAARAIATDKDLHGTVAAAAADVTVNAWQRAGRAAAAAELLAAAGYAHAVLVFGPFGDEGDHYLGVPFAPELTLAGSERLPGRFGPVTPRVAKFDVSAALGEIALRDPRTGHQGCFYALHQPAVEQAVACYLELWAPGSFAVFVNGAPVGRFDSYADPFTGTHRLPIVLRKGTNHVLVKTALNGYDRIALRYVDGAGRSTLVREPANPERVEPMAAAQGEEPPAPGPFVTPLLALDRAARAAAGTDAATLRLACALHAASANDHRRTLEHVLAVEQASPEDVPTRLALACALGSAELLPDEIRRSRSRAVLDSLRDQVSAHSWAREQSAQHLADEDKVEDAIRMLQADVDGKRAGPGVFARLHGFYEKLEFRADAARLRTAWLQSYPGDARAVLAEVAERQRDGDAIGAKQVLLAARAVARGDAQINQRLLNLAVDLGDADLALAVHADLTSLRQTRADTLRSRAEVLTRLGRRDDAVRAWNDLASHPDAGARELTRAGQALLAAGAEVEGKRVLTMSLARDPSQHGVRKLLGRLGGGAGDYPALAPFRRDVAALAAAFVPGEDEKGAASTLVLDQMIVEILEDGSSVEETHQLRRINDLSGVEKHQEARDAARADELVALHTITPDGKRYVPHRVGGSFSMPRLAPGAFVAATWRRMKPAPGAEPWRGPEFHFQSADEPYALSELVVVLPKDSGGTFRTRNFNAAPEVKELPDGRVAHVFTRRAVPRLTPEKLAPATEEIVPLVTWGRDRVPGATARRAMDYFAYRLRSSTLVEAKAAELTRGVDGDHAKLAAVHAFVHDTIPTSSGASDPTAVLLRKQGARFWLEVALLRAAGLPLRLATAARTPDALRDEAPSLFAGEAEYGVDAALVEPADGHAVWLFADDPRHWPLGHIATERMLAPALLLEPGGFVPARVSAGDPEAGEGFAVAGEVVLDDRGTATFRVRGTLRGHEGFLAADQLREREDNIKKLAARQVASEVLEGWAPRSAELEFGDKAPLGLRGELLKRRAVSAAGDVSLLDLPLGKRGWLADLGDRSERKQPLALTNYAAASWEVTLDPGQTFQLVEVPADVLVRHPLLEYAQTFRLAAGKLVVRRQWLQRPGRLAPALYGEWLDLLRRLDLAEDGKVRLATRS